MNVVVLVGSSRTDSYNALLADAAVAYLPEGASVTRFDHLDELPFFTEHLELTPPAAVEELRDAVAAADALIVTTPEYNASVSAILKNAIDWISRPRDLESRARETAALAGKPVAMLGATPSVGATAGARAHLRDILVRAQAQPLDDSVGIAAAHEAFVGGELVDAGHADAVRSLVESLAVDHVPA